MADLESEDWAFAQRSLIRFECDECLAWRWWEFCGFSVGFKIMVSLARSVFRWSWMFVPSLLEGWL